MIWDLFIILLYVISGALFITSAISDVKRRKTIALGLDVMSIIAIILLMAKFIFKSM